LTSTAVLANKIHIPIILPPLLPSSVVPQVTGESPDVWVQKNIFAPLQMVDTSFSVPMSKINRYRWGGRQGGRKGGRKGAWGGGANEKEGEDEAEVLIFPRR
jgi:CubicO group peptidase (beta-lactamase class C family)